MPSTWRQTPELMTVTDFLDWPGDGSGRKFQLVDGELRAMSPGSATHAIIQANLAAAILRRLDETGSTCSVGTEPAIATRVRANSNLRVPDIGVTCSPNEPGHRTFPDPVLLIEVLSPGNQADTWDNVWAYTTIPTVEEILVVHSTRLLAQLLRRLPDGAWPAEPQQIEADEMLTLESVGLSSPLRQIYARTHLV
jgi:Uma2 family endonuclease